VFARTIGLPNDPVAAVELLAGGIDRADLRPIGLGRVNGRFFCFHTGIGFDAAVVAAVERRASLKRWFGHPLFITAALSTWLRGYDRKTPHFSVRTAERVIDDGYFSIVLNTNPYTYLGNRPLDLSPAATLDRGLVAVTFRTMKASAILRSLAGALRGGGVEATDYLDEQIDLDELCIEGSEPFPYQVDGDYLGEADTLRFQHVPDAVRLVFPVPPGEIPTDSTPPSR
jgi:diacylglycerol kinase family enzyme